MTYRSIEDVSASSERNVSFSTIEFHEHMMILGCSPSTTEGPPLEIAWDKVNTCTFSLDDYEELRPPRRVRNELIMPGIVREEVLMENGYTRNQITTHLQRLKDERRMKRSSMPVRILGKAKRSLLGALTSGKA